MAIPDLLKNKKLQSFVDDVKLPIIMLLAIWAVGIYIIWLSFFNPLTFNVAGAELRLPIPTSSIQLERFPPPKQNNGLLSVVNRQLEKEKEQLVAKRRKERIQRVESFFESYGSPLVGYASIFVDKAEECGGSYRVLVGIAGSESGLGRINYKKYNPFGYLDGVQYANQKEALEILICKISWNHLSVCKEDLQCLVRRYAGPGDDAQHFVSKVAWFMAQV